MSEPTDREVWKVIHDGGEKVCDYAEAQWQANKYGCGEAMCKEMLPLATYPAANEVASCNTKGGRKRMSDLTVSRKQRLRTLENQIRSNYEAFVQTGFALMEIRDQKLYREDDFETWDSYLKQRVGEQFGIEERQAQRLMACAQVRPKLPEISRHACRENDEEESWSQAAVLEFGRLAPKSEEHEQRPDYNRLDKRDVQRVAKKVLAHCEEEEVKPTASIVRKFVDEDLGIDRAAQGKETKRQREEEGQPELGQFLIDLTGRIEAETEKLESIPEDVWTLLRRERPKVIGRLIAAAVRLADFFREVDS